MAKIGQKEIVEALIASVTVVAGAVLIPKIEFVANIVNKLAFDVMGIGLPAVVYGAAALLAVSYFRNR